MNKPEISLVIGDSHVTNGQDNSRFDALGNLILELKPDNIIDIGDFLTLNCLSAWDLDKRKTMEGRRYALEIAAGNECLDLLEAPINKYNKKRRKNKEKLYLPNKIKLGGNHDGPGEGSRLGRYLAKDPTFDGHISIEKDLKLKERGWITVPYGEYYYIHDVGFTHIPFGVGGPISGSINITKKALDVTIKSVVFGHTHRLEFQSRHIEGMDHLQQALNVGCFFEDDEPYMAHKVTNHWKGIVILYHYDNMRFDFETISMSQLKTQYL